jgi:hypothetical protein
MKHRNFLQVKRPIGFIANTPEIVMEEAADASEYGPAQGRAYAVVSPEAWEHLIRDLMDERIAIIKGDFKMEDKLKLLENNRKSLASLRGYSFGTEKVIYAILLFSAFVLLVLSWLTAYHGLAKEITITFAGTVVGGTIATIAQKLGKIGS